MGADLEGASTCGAVQCRCSRTSSSTCLTRLELPAPAYRTVQICPLPSCKTLCTTSGNNRVCCSLPASVCGAAHCLAAPSGRTRPATGAFPCIGRGLHAELAGHVCCGGWALGFICCTPAACPPLPKELIWTCVDICAIRAVVLAIWTTQPLPPRLVNGQRCLLLWHGHVHCQLQTLPPSSQHEIFPGLPCTWLQLFAKLQWTTSLP